MPPWEPSLGTFHAWLEDGSIVFITVDQAATAGIGLDHSRAFSFVTELKMPTENGLISGAERPRLDEFEDAVEAVLAENAEPWPVGWRTERGRRFVFFYLTEEMRIPDLDRKWPHGYELRWRVARDPEWHEYQDSLAATRFQKFLIDSNRQLFERSKLGDDRYAKRAVDHTVLFADTAATQAGAKDLAQAGFAIEIVDAKAVTCTREHDLSITTIERVIEQILQVTEVHGSQYDGWGAPVIPQSTSRTHRK